MKKIAFHSYQLGSRGTEICLYKYAKYNREILGNESVIISTSSRPIPSANRFREFPTFLYPQVWKNDGVNQELRTSLERLCDAEGITHFYAIKGGEDDNFMPTNTKRLAHNIFRMDEPHADVYAGVCKYISDKYGGIHPYVYHIIEKEAPNCTESCRDELGIPKDAIVLGRHGGRDTFSLEFVKDAVRNVLPHRKDIYYVFLNTQEFIQHEQVKYLPWTMDEEVKAKFVNTCDAMIHARYDGEIFSLSTAEFSIRNKPVITWKPDIIPAHYDHGHLVVLGDRCITYKDGGDLENILTHLSRGDILEDSKWDMYGDTFSPKAIMNQFNDVFLK
jgi:hypothetical protein